MDKNINPENRDTVFGDVNAPGADHSPKKFDLNASLPEVDNEDPFENGGKVLVQPEKGGREALSFKSGSSVASDAPMPHGRTSADFPQKLTDAPNRPEVARKIESDVVKESAQGHGNY
jgi:hypothetical protein